jgi:hypothetical protein
VAGEGTALKIGDKVSAADVWSEISQPPYFVAYHGALTEDEDIAVFAHGGQHWATISGPQSLAAGAEWKLKSQDGLSRTLTVKALQGLQATIVDRDEHFPDRIITLDAAWNNNAWTIDRMRYVPNTDDEKLGLTISFTPGVSTVGGESKFEVIAGRKTRIASGTVHADAEQKLVAWEFKDPQWLRGKKASVESPTVAEKPAETASK